MVAGEERAVMCGVVLQSALRAQSHSLLSAERGLALAGFNSWETKVCMKTDLPPPGAGCYECKEDVAVAGPCASVGKSR